MIKAVFFDIDGTLVSFNTHRVPDSTIKALDILRKKGIKVFIATGRQFPAINNLGDLSFDGYITMNGSFCFVGDYEVVHKQSIPQEDIRALIDYTRRKNTFPCFFVSEKDAFGNYINEKVELIFEQLNFPTPNLQPIEYAIDKDIYQVIAFYDINEEQELLATLPHCEATRWSPYFSDLVPKGSGKDIGIKSVIEHYGIRQEETMAFGDGGNDISMLRYVHTGVAMGNANDDVKLQADYVTSSVDEDGIWNALKHFELI